MKAINPATEHEIGDYSEHRLADVERLLEAAGRAWKDWRGQAIAERASLMSRAASVLRSRSAEPRC